MNINRMLEVTISNLGKEEHEKKSYRYSKRVKKVDKVLHLRLKSFSPVL